jgi:uncharacterized protein (DUF1786 family)
VRILAIDVGTGTQDILLLNSAQPVENAVQMIMPSPTQIAAKRIRRATAHGSAVLLEGVVAGGGPCSWALEDHLRAGYPAFATPEAAATFDDDLDAVRRMGVTIVSADEARAVEAQRVVLRDLDLDAVRDALTAFDVDTLFDGVALGCLDHGASPPGQSDRLFRFEHLRRVVESRNDLRAFAMLPDEIPDYLTRARAIVRSADPGVPTVFLDTGPAAALGALQDPAVGSEAEQCVLNLGNMHVLCFHLRGTRIVSLYEHHTGEISTEQIVDFTERLLAGDLPHEEVFNTSGHGVYYGGQSARPAGRPVWERALSAAEGRADGPRIAVTGPRRNKVRGTRLNPYFAAPHGDMMVSGCFGLLWAFAERHPGHRDEILAALGVATVPA